MGFGEVCFEVNHKDWTCASECHGMSSIWENLVFFIGKCRGHDRLNVNPNTAESGSI